MALIHQTIKDMLRQRQGDEPGLSDLFVNPNGMLCKNILGRVTAIDVGPFAVGEYYCRGCGKWHQDIAFVPTRVSRMMSKKSAWKELCDMGFAHEKAFSESFDRNAMIDTIWNHKED